MSALPTAPDGTEIKELMRWLRNISARDGWGTFTWDPPSVAANTTSETTVSLGVGSGVRSGSGVFVAPTYALPAGLVVVYGYSAAAESVTIRLANLTASPIDAPSGTWYYLSMATRSA